jgi:GYF domain 2/Domain of unknown function (DUF4190)
MSVGSGGWYVRTRGRVLGPFNWSQLESMRDRGQLSQAHEVSQDRRSWIKATELAGLYTPAGAGPSRPSTTANTEWPVYAVADDASGSPGAQAAAAAPASWFVARGESHHGPLSLADLQRMIDQGELGSSALVWTNGMANWTPAGQVAGLWFGTSAAGGSTDTTRAATSPSQPYGISRTSGLALGLLWLCGIGSLLATIFGGIALSQISRSNGTISGKGLALAGLILGTVGLCLIALAALGILLGALQRPRWDM